MKLLVQPRRSGKTMELIRACHQNGGYIVCHSHAEARRVHLLAQDVGMPIPFPLIPREWVNGSYSNHVRCLYFDNLDAIVASLSHAPVEAVTWTAAEDDPSSLSGISVNTRLSS